jgi:NAD-dependent SIR2 family protein deacetylase/thioredoxin-like negative regulator of GroEL
LTRPSLAKLTRDAARHEKAGHLEEALACHLEMRKLRPRSSTILNRIGDLYDRLGRVRPAIQAWEDCARSFRDDGFHLQAIAVLKKASRRDPKDLRLRSKLAELHHLMGHVTEAKVQYADLAEEWLRRSQPGNAIRALERLVEIDPDPASRELLARLHEQAASPKKAASHHLALARDLANEGKWAEARVLLEKAIALAPGNAAAKGALAEAYRHERMWDEAARLLTELLAQRPREAQLVLRLAECHERRDRLGEARTLYARALEAKPEDDEVRCRLGLLLAREGDADGAYALVGPVAERLLDRRDFRGAAAILDELAERVPDHVPTLLKLASVYHGLGDRAALIATYDRIVLAHRERGDGELARAAGEVRSILAARGPRLFPGPTKPDAPTPAPSDVEELVERAAATIRGAGALLIAAGAGMNVDYGWVDYRDRESLWASYPAYRERDLSFTDLAHPSRFADDPGLAWGFYGHRLEASRRRAPHAGFEILSRWKSLCPGGGFVVTSCVDGEFQRAGFDSLKIAECCGTLEWLQCTKSCGAPTFSAEATRVAVDPATLRASAPWPSCPECGAVARPNILLFGDWDWDMARITEQDERLQQWLASRAVSGNLVVVECGETPRLPALRAYVRRLVSGLDAPIVRISSKDATVEPGGVGVPLPATEGLERINERIRLTAPDPS